MLWKARGTREGWSLVGLGLSCALFAGCGNEGTAAPGVSVETPGASVKIDDQGVSVSTQQVTKQAQPAPTEPPKGQQASSGKKIDTKALVDVVKGDVAGGEAASGGSPENILWLPPDPTLIKDEPYTPEVPAGLQSLLAYAPASNPITKGKVELGKQLYFDPRVSLDGTVSCATCHNPARGWGDGLKTSTGIDGQVGGRNAPTVLNTVFGKTMFWDGRAPSLEGQSQGPPQNPIEMGKQSYQQIIERLRAIPGYREQFKKVFGTDVTLDGFAKAIATFERVTALTGNSAYDKYNAGDTKALTDSQKRGMVLFGLRLSPDDEFSTNVVLKKAECTSCHVGFNFTDEQFHNLGVGWDEKTGKFADLGRFVIEPIGAKNPASVGAFKTPTVRDAEKTAPYMHDGSLKTLEEVVEHYDKGGIANPALDKDMKKLNLTAQEKADVVAFMKALTGERPKFNMPTLPPGPDGKSPNPADALVPPKAKTASIVMPHPGVGH
ncbi:MAG: cytochrome c peroxidase [Isosphaeraceae bacterium]